MESYLLVEGINIYANLFDTNQLSIVRGGSFLLKQAIVDIKEYRPDDLEVISEGASSGLFKQKRPGDSDRIQTEIIHFLSTHPLYSLLTFCVETCDAIDLLGAKERLLTQLRLHQLQGATLVPDCPIGRSKGVSAWSGVRALDSSPQTVTYYLADGSRDEIHISSSEKRRWEYGRKQKQNYYLQETHQLLLSTPQNSELKKLKDRLENYSFTRDLEELSSSPGYPDLSDKVAIFYADGNSFGKLQQKLLEIAHDKDQTQKQFDSTLQNLRRAFLASAMQAMLDKRFPDMETKTRIGNQGDLDALRFETLLWGGDEMLFVMPAWIGFDFVQFFFDLTADWRIHGHPLTHSVGLVLCSAKTPIRITRQLAQMIADHIKEQTGKERQGKRNAWDYMVLESIDYPTRMDFADFCRTRYGIMADHRPPCIEPGGRWKQEAPEIQQVLDKNLPTRQLHKIAHALVDGDICLDDEVRDWPPPSAIPSPLEALELRLLSLCEDGGKAVEKLIPRLGELFGLDHQRSRQRAWIWLHLAELKDYLAPRKEKS